MIANILTTIFEYIKGFVEIFGLSAGYTYGFSIILFTLIIKVLLLPINIKQAKSQAKMQEIQPKLQEIQNKYKNDPQKQQAELAKLYQESGASPLGGCLPLLIQMPIFIAMYALIRELGPELKGLRFTPLIPDLGASGNILLTIIYALSSYFSMTIMMPKDNPQAKTMGTTNLVMTVFSAFITYSVAAGLGVYLITSSVFAILQNLFMKKMGYSANSKKDDGVQNSKDVLKETNSKSFTPKGKGSSKKKGKK
ncbi:MAG: YidC/Oxa1 family membrane protein insertase [Clostridiales bacterium]|uniref:YidC/Oxa1 family membrane protein insertase n=1 Tax=Clostridium sp. N3C TaxID=1776758 RepID=UPI00092E08F1|nr:YidC/Oxa1 family membrane protein insertase [Clostridium sp. N3C]NLZ47664.1 YidC/Oxa1 family membrane protein insertase [Clostridiales bacterium]SCN26324.1 Oxa1Ec [Clostridium sp. N3C]